MTEKRGLGRWARTFIAVGLVLAVLVTVLVWGFRSVISLIPTTDELAAVVAPEPYEEIGPVVITSIRNLANLTTVEAVEYIIVEKGTDAGWLAWARGDSVRLFAVATIGAGVDLGRVSIDDVSVEPYGLVRLSAPKAEVQYVAVDNEATQILDRDIGLLTKGDPRLETEARRVAEEVLLTKTVESGLLDRAEENARRVLTDFLLSLGYRDVIVVFVG